MAGALWLSGHLVLEEYATRRHGGGPLVGAGRTDLWCRIDANDYTIEAKQDVKLSYPATPRSLAARASMQLQTASSQCANDAYGAQNRIAMVFIVPSLNAQPSLPVLDAWINAVTAIDADIKAHYLSTAAPQSAKTMRFYPGVVLIAKVITARRRAPVRG